MMFDPELFLLEECFDFDQTSFLTKKNVRQMSWNVPATRTNTGHLNRLASPVQAVEVR